MMVVGSMHPLPFYASNMFVAFFRYGVLCASTLVLILDLLAHVDEALGGVVRHIGLALLDL
jgi:hypothetical protein